MTGTADGSIIYPGDYRTWELDYSATSSVWRLVDSHCFVKNENIKVGTVGTVAAGLTEDWAFTHGNFVMTTGTTGPLVYTLPAITTYMSGFVMTFHTTSATSLTLTPNTTTGDAIEATAGTLTATSDSTLDADGDLGIYMAIHSGDVAGASSVWMCVSENVT